MEIVDKGMYQMDEQELETLITQQEHAVAKLNQERPGSSEHRLDAGILSDAKQLLAQKRKTKKPTNEVLF